MNLFEPPKSYIDYRCYIHRLSGSELSISQEKFFKKHSEQKTEICNFLNSLDEARQNSSLPIEKIEVRERDGKKHGYVMEMQIFDIEYWIEGGRIKQKKIYIPIRKEPGKLIDLKKRSAGEREPGEEG